MTTEIVPLASIHVGLSRVRQDFGDLDYLAHSIREHGLLQPLVVQPNGSGYNLVAGERRYHALSMLAAEQPEKYSRVEANVLPAGLSDARLLEIELAENVARLNLSPFEKADAAVRMMRADNLSVPTGVRKKDVVAEQLQWSRMTQDHAVTVYELGHKDSQHSDLLVALAQPGARVDPIYQEAMRRMGAEYDRNVPLPEPPGEEVTDPNAGAGELARLMLDAHNEEDVALLRVRHTNRHNAAADLREFNRRRNVTQSRYSDLWAALGGDEERVAMALAEVGK